MVVLALLHPEWVCKGNVFLVEYITAMNDAKIIQLYGVNINCLTEHHKAIKSSQHK